jgi:hypothetical protein
MRKQRVLSMVRMGSAVRIRKSALEIPRVQEFSPEPFFLSLRHPYASQRHSYLKNIPFSESLFQVVIQSKYGRAEWFIILVKNSKGGAV